MPVFYQQQINEKTRLGIWKIEETEEFFKGNVPQHRDVSHPHKRLQHLAGRFLLQYLFPDFPYELIQVAETRKPFLPNEKYHFSISHCGDYAAAIVSSTNRVGIDIEIPVQKILALRQKFLSEEERGQFMLDGLSSTTQQLNLSTLFWSSKESVFKWYGDGAVDFRKDIQLKKMHEGKNSLDCYFSKTGMNLEIHYREFEELVMAFVIS